MVDLRLVRNLFCYLFFVGTLAPLQLLRAQETETIKIRKESNLSKVVLDNTRDLLLVIDRFGNPKDNKIVSYKLFVKTKKETREFQGYSNRLTGEMVTYLNKQTKATKIFFTEITAKDDDEHLVKLPDLIDTWFPDCKNCDPLKKK
ncbi:MAG: hypothetical protein PSX36_06550 [bacterium]|nr:hypothetical protein [bacterium]